MKNNYWPKARKTNIVLQQLSDEVLVYDLDTNKALCLNETSAAVWRACNGKNDVSGISSILSKEFNKTISEDVVEFGLEQLSAENLIDGYKPKLELTSRTSRREAIRKIALTSVVALPIVASISAPMAVNAQSGCPSPPGSVPVGGTCTQDCECSGELGAGFCGETDGAMICIDFDN